MNPARREGHRYRSFVIRERAERRRVKVCERILRAGFRCVFPQRCFFISHRPFSLLII